ncbi:MAG: hypothetical protein L0221_19260 [Chloroflexi bacterium]|nr:hypothetical protein [Chloroflexota bacterium]
MRFQDAAPDARAVTYASVQADPLVARTAGLLAAADTAQRVLARAVMNGESTDPRGWRTAFPSLFGSPSPGDPGAAARRARSEALLEASLEVAKRGDEVRSQFRGAIVEALTALLLERRAGPAAIRRERRILFDGRAAEIHPYDVTVERPGAAEAYDCKWGARGINPEVLLQLDAARAAAADEEARLTVALVIFDARRSCAVRMARLSKPTGKVGLVALESLDRLAGALAVAPAAVSPGSTP